MIIEEMKSSGNNFFKVSDSVSTGNGIDSVKWQNKYGAIILGSLITKACKAYAPAQEVIFRKLLEAKLLVDLNDIVHAKKEKSAAAATSEKNNQEMSREESIHIRYFVQPSIVFMHSLFFGTIKQGDTSDLLKINLENNQNLANLLFTLQQIEKTKEETVTTPMKVLKWVAILVVFLIILPILYRLFRK